MGLFLRKSSLILVYMLFPYILLNFFTNIGQMKAMKRHLKLNAVFYLFMYGCVNQNENKMAKKQTITLKQWKADFDRSNDVRIKLMNDLFTYGICCVKHIGNQIQRISPRKAIQLRDNPDYTIHKI